MVSLAGPFAVESTHRPEHRLDLRRLPGVLPGVGVARHHFWDPPHAPLTPAYAGAVIAITVFGWAIGGLLGGVLADYLGRKRSMTLTILAYSLLTGVSALSWDWVSFAVF